MSNRRETSDAGISRRTFVIHMGAAAALLGVGVPARAQAPPAPIPGKEKLIVRSPRPINLETPLKELTSDLTRTSSSTSGTTTTGPRWIRFSTSSGWTARWRIP